MGGAVCTDSISLGGNKIQTRNPVNTEKVGTYVVTYRIKDKAGNWNDGKCKAPSTTSAPSPSRTPSSPSSTSSSAATLSTSPRPPTRASTARGTPPPGSWPRPPPSTAGSSAPSPPPSPVLLFSPSATSRPSPLSPSKLTTEFQDLFVGGATPAPGGAALSSAVT